MSGNPATAMTSLEKRVLYVAIVASFIAFLDGSVVNLALPAISRELGGGLVVQQWVVDAYLLTLGALILVAGSLSDQFGRVRVLQWGLAGFTLTSVLCGLAWNGESLIVARGLQGVAGALLVPSSLALIVTVFSGQAQSAAIGRWSAWTSGAIVAAPLLGGVSVDVFTWRMIFFLNVVPAAAVWPALRRLREQDLERAPGSTVDITGTVLAVIGLGGIVYAFIERGSLGWGSPQVWLPLGLGVAGLVAFLLHEARTPAPMMPLRLFTIRNFGWGNIATMVIYGALSLGFFVLGLYLQQVAGLGATAAGFALLPSTLILLLLSARVGTLSGRFGPRWFMTAGPVLCAAGFLMLLGVGLPLDYFAQVFPGMVVFGIGLAVTVAPLTAAILGAVDPEEAGIGSAVNNAVARIAGLVAIAFAGLITGPVITTAGLHATAAVTAALFLAGAAASAVGIRNPQPNSGTSGDSEASGDGVDGGGAPAAA
ncbi:MFS transporter [Arthrobacter sp. B3I4]|uniref:MFS transporter n=1 Tax=Arthrobacter sp. B3I4 TaxID=3042267 RepID=UPI00277E538D|nr:MFS transporter [Arthrobacter sp. B3I4]MDQ0755795.1 EmrB/QacA subfamily drug resistance transporter [Arthrobacter sp. B3I4]